MDAPGVMPGKAVEYPTRDGRPMGETDDHRDEMKDYAINVLKDHFKDDPQVYVSGNNFIYYTEGDTADCVSPDTYVVKGVPKHQRDVFKVWEEGGRIPCFVLEVTSRGTRREDLGDKMTKYRDDLRAEEYFLFDPRGEWIPERLRGYALKGGTYQPIVPSSSGRLVSSSLGLDVGVRDGHLRFFVPGATEPLPTPDERAELERGRAERSEAEVRRLRAELESLRRSGPKGSPPTPTP